MSRERLTWTRQADSSKTASPPPQIPAVDRTESPDHPAYLPDPPADKYQSGDTSSWAEDPHPPPYPEGPPPAMPGNGTTEEVSHPAAVTPAAVSPATGPTTAEEADARAPKQASDIRVAAENKAQICVGIAQATLKEATVADIERRAMELMDLPNDQIQAAANVLNVRAADDEDQDEASDDDDDAKMSGKKATQEITARLATLERQSSRLLKAFSDFFGMDGMDDMGMDEGMDMEVGMMDDGEGELDMMVEETDMSDDDLMASLMGMDQDGDGIDQSDNSYPMATSEFDEGEESEGTKEFDEGQMLAALMAELGEGHMANDAELSVEPLAKGPGIQSGEGGNVNPEPAPVTPEVEQMDGSEKTADDPSENDIAMTSGVDPMGLMDDSTTAAGPNDELLALYADLNLPKTAKKGDDEEEEAEEDDDADTDAEAEADDEEYDADDEGKKAKKASQQRPQARTASAGPKTLGTVSQTKKASDEIAELSQIWDQAPDVREFFGIPK
jgi:hypothetical protein